MVNVLRQIKNKPEKLLWSPLFSILRLTFCGKSASKFWIQDIILKTFTHASTISACFPISIELICKKCQIARLYILCLEPQMPKISEKPTAQLACKSVPLLASQRNAILMAFLWRANSGLRRLLAGCPLVKFVTSNLTSVVLLFWIVLILFPIP